MELLKEIKDVEIPFDRATVKKRESARAVLFDDEEKIPLLYMANCNFYDIPGGGIEERESKLEGMMREVREEVGAEIEVCGELGEIIEYRSRHNLIQISYCYYGQIVSKGEPALTDEEKAQGTETLWLSLDEAIERVKNNKNENYKYQFIQKRCLVALEKARELFG